MERACVRRMLLAFFWIAEKSFQLGFHYFKRSIDESLSAVPKNFQYFFFIWCGSSMSVNECIKNLPVIFAGVSTVIYSCKYQLQLHLLNAGSSSYMSFSFQKYRRQARSTAYVQMNSLEFFKFSISWWQQPVAHVTYLICFAGILWAGLCTI